MGRAGSRGVSRAEALEMVEVFLAGAEQAAVDAARSGEHMRLWFEGIAYARYVAARHMARKLDRSIENSDAWPLGNQWCAWMFAAVRGDDMEAA